MVMTEGPRAVSWSGLARAVTPTGDCVSCGGEAEVGSWC